MATLARTFDRVVLARVVGFLRRAVSRERFARDPVNRDVTFSLAIFTEAAQFEHVLIDDAAGHTLDYLVLDKEFDGLFNELTFVFLRRLAACGFVF